MPVAEKASVEVKIGGGHSPQSVPSNLGSWLEGKLDEMGLPYHFVANLSRAQRSTGTTRPDSIRAIRIEDKSVLIVCKPGNNNTCRRFYLSSPDLDPEVVKQKIDEHNATEEGEKMGDPLGDKELKEQDAWQERERWFDTSPDGISIYLLGLDEKATRGKGPDRYVLRGQARKVIQDIVTKPILRGNSVDDVLAFLEARGLTRTTKRATESGDWFEIRFTPAAEEIITTANVPGTKKAATTTPKPQPRHKLSVIDFAMTIGKMGEELKPHEESLQRLGQLRHERKTTAEKLSAIDGEIAKLESSLPGEAVLTYKKLVKAANGLGHL